MTITNNDINKYKLLVYKIAEFYRKKTLDYKTYIDWDEIKQVGLIALYKALLHYNKNKNVPFKYYVNKAVHRAIQRQLIYDRKTENNSDIDMFHNIIGAPDVEVNGGFDKELAIKRLTKIIDSLPCKEINKKILKDTLYCDTLTEVAKKNNVQQQWVSAEVKRYKDRILKAYYGGKYDNE